MEHRLGNYTIDIKLVLFQISCAHLQLHVYSSLIQEARRWGSEATTQCYPHFTGENNSTSLPQMGDTGINALKITGTITTWGEEMHQYHIFHSSYSYDHFLRSASVVLHLWTDSNCLFPLKKYLVKSTCSFFTYANFHLHWKPLQRAYHKEYVI